MKNIKICIIGVYFGTLRKDFSLWLNSCEWNSDVDYLLITDADLSAYDLPANVYIHKTTLAEVALLASNQLGYEVMLNAPYKLCDFRPAFGIIFQEFIKGYDYWGHCDFDMMFGRISHFAKMYNIEEYVHFLTQGHLSLYKNIPELKEYMYLDGGLTDARTAFTSDKNYAFDENYGIGRVYIKHGISQFDKNIYADISPIWKRMRRSPYYTLDKIPKDYRYQLFVWDKGKALWLHTDGNEPIVMEEVLYLHFQKRHLALDVDALKTADKIVFTPTHIIPWEGDITIRDIAVLNPPRPFLDRLDFLKWKAKKNYTRIIRKLKG